MAETGTVAWEYLFLQIEGHKTYLSEADNMLVTTSDGRWDRERHPHTQANIIAILDELGGQCWEMINSSGASGAAGAAGAAAVAPSGSFQAVFKRRRPAG